MEEEGVEFSTDGIFYNPEMKFCRGISSLAVGALGKVKVLDAFCASGIRGLRYAKENKNVSSVVFLDWSTNAVKLSKANARKNKVRKAKFADSDVNRFLVDGFYEEKYDFDLIELDPFGTPSPYIYPAFFSMQKKKSFYLSATATDTAVLCGHEATACLKNYHAKSLNNEFTHENGLRILVKRIAEVGAEFNFGIEPLFCLSDRHYLKVFLKCEANAVLAAEAMRKLGYVSACSCGWRTSGKRMVNKCGRCGKETDYGGQLWIGELCDKKFLGVMEKLNNKRGYSNDEEIAKVLGLLKGEVGLPLGYFNIHKMCKRIKSGGAPRMQAVMDALRKKGFIAVRTHFSDVSLKTDAPVDAVEKALRAAMRGQQIFKMKRGV